MSVPSLWKGLSAVDSIDNGKVHVSTVIYHDEFSSFYSSCYNSLYSTSYSSFFSSQVAIPSSALLLPERGS
jgi:hypothetical protein